MALLTVKELASELSVSRDTVWRAYRKGEIPGERIRNVLRFDLALVRNAMRDRDESGKGRPHRGRAATDRRRAPVSPRLVIRGRK